MKDLSKYRCSCCNEVKPRENQHFVPFDLSLPEEMQNKVAICDECMSAISEAKCEDVCTYRRRPTGVSAGDVWVVISPNDPESEWLFQVMAVLVMNNEKFYACIKIGEKVCPEYMVLFDANGEEVESASDFMHFSFLEPYDQDEHGETWAKEFEKRPIRN